MNRQEEIINATLSLAAQNGLGNVSMAQIADRVGIKKPSLYNHFKSKDELVEAMYEYIRQKSKAQSSSFDMDLSVIFKEKSAIQILNRLVANYINMNSNSEIVTFYKVIYSERAINPLAAKIMSEETKRMINATKNLFYAMQVHKLLHFDNPDTAAVSFALTVHGFIDYANDSTLAGDDYSNTELNNYIKWFAEHFEYKEC